MISSYRESTRQRHPSEVRSADGALILNQAGEEGRPSFNPKQEKIDDRRSARHCGVSDGRQFFMAVVPDPKHYLLIL